MFRLRLLLSKVVATDPLVSAAFGLSERLLPVGETIKTGSHSPEPKLSFYP
jgi:hypothetical protein